MSATEPLPDPAADRDTSLTPALPGGTYYEPRPGTPRPPRTWWAASMSAPGGRTGLYVEYWGRYYEHRGNTLASVDRLPPDAVALVPGHRPGLQPPEGYGP